MNKTELIAEAAERVDIPKALAKRVIEAIFDPEMGIISLELRGGGDVNITGFGKFVPHQREARTGVVPGTGERREYPAKTLPKFRPGSTLKSAVNND